MKHGTKNDNNQCRRPHLGGPQATRVKNRLTQEFPSLWGSMVDDVGNSVGNWWLTS